MMKSIAALLLTALLCFGVGYYVQNGHIRALEQRVTTLEKAERERTPPAPFIKQAVQDMFTMAFNDYGSRIDRAEKLYLTP